MSSIVGLRRLDTLGEAAARPGEREGGGIIAGDRLGERGGDVVDTAPSVRSRPSSSLLVVDDFTLFLSRSCGGDSGFEDSRV